MKSFASVLTGILGALSFAGSAWVSGASAQDLKGDATAGKGKAAMCIGCHGIVGYQASFPEVYKVPMISGQSAKFIASSLAAYKAGDRKHPTMKGISASLTDQDMADLAAFYAGQKAAPAKHTAPTPNARVAELLKTGNCAACHGEGLNKPISPDYPKLAGQHADYLNVALKAYRTEGNPNIGRSNGVMKGIVTAVDDKKKPVYSNADLKALANYIATLPGDMAVVPQSSFRTK